MKIYEQINETKNAAGLPVFAEIHAYSIYLETETEKHDFIQAARRAGAVVTGVSGCGRGYYIQIDATEEQSAFINRILYTRTIDAYTAPEAWQAWKNGVITVWQLATWQERNNIYFDPEGNAIPGGGAK